MSSNEYDQNNLNENSILIAKYFYRILIYSNS